MVDQTEFRDPYEVRIGIPTASWKYARRGEGYRGILLPQDGRAYVLSQQSDIAGNLLWWSTPTGQVPRVQQDMLFGFTTDLKGNALGPNDFISNKATERFDTARTSGDPEAVALIERVNKFGLRRQIIKGESLEKGMRVAVASQAATLGPKPVVAAIVTFTLAKLEPNDHGGETKIYEIKYEAPTDASKAKVQEYLAALPQHGDPYASNNSTPLTNEPGSGARDDDEEPPF
jgi:hypothetical protein